MNEEDVQAMLAYLRDIARSTREIADVQSMMLARSAQSTVYVPGGLMMRQDGDHMQVDAEPGPVEPDQPKLNNQLNGS